MPKMSKKIRRLWEFFINPKTGRRQYNRKCRRCRKACKQSCRAEIVQCTRYAAKSAPEAPGRREKVH